MRKARGKHDRIYSQFVVVVVFSALVVIGLHSFQLTAHFLCNRRTKTIIIHEIRSGITKNARVHCTH